MRSALASRAPGSWKLGFDEAVACARAFAEPLAKDCIPLTRALGAILADEVRARSSCPLFDMSAMDGFALPAAMTNTATEGAPCRIPINGESFAGHFPSPGLVGSAYRITTGAAIPTGCDAVLISEHARTTSDGQALLVSAPVRAGANIRRAGEDASDGEQVLGAGSIIDAAAIGALASYGVHEVCVRELPTVAVFTTGDELAEVGAAPSGASICDSNGPMIAAQAMEAGACAWLAPKVRDDATAIARSIEQISAERRPHIIVSTGGVSVGSRDYVPEALLALGATIRFHGVTMRPGKPVLFATLADGTLFFGLPGNPVAAYTGFRFFVYAALRSMLGLPAEEGRPVSTAVPARPGMTVLHKVQVRASENTLIVEQLGGQSHMMRPFLAANGWLAVSGDGRARIFPLRCGTRDEH